MLGVNARPRILPGTSAQPTGGVPTSYAPGSMQGPNKANAPTDMGIKVTLVIFAVLYVIWAKFAEHERVSQSVQPKNIMPNLWNLGVIGLAAALGLTLVNYLAVKGAAHGVPGAKYVSTFLSAV